MNNTEIYNIMLSAEKFVDGREYPLLGFAYQIFKEARDGQVFIREHGHPTKIILWDKDGPELADLAEQMVKDRIEEVLA